MLYYSTFVDETSIHAVNCEKHGAFAHCCALCFALVVASRSFSTVYLPKFLLCFICKGLKN